MPPLSLLIIIYFLLVAFISDISFKDITNPFLSYYDIQVGFILSHLRLFCLGLLVTTVVFVIYNGRRRKFFKNYTRFIQRIFALSIVGSLVSFVILFVIAIVEVNVLSLLTNINLKFLGVETNSQVIVDKLISNDLPPTVIAGEGRNNALPLTIATASSGKDSFYGSRIIPSTPFIVVPAKEIEEGVLMVGNALIVNKIDSPDFQKVSPVVSYLMIRKYFPDKNIKSYPQVALMDKGEYLDYRKGDFGNKLEKFDEVIAKIQDNTETLLSDTEKLKSQISENETRLKQTSFQKEKDYTRCINSGFYKSGTYYRTYTKSYCQEQITQLEDLVKQINKEGEELESSLNENQAKLEQYQFYDKFYKSQKLLTQEESTYASFEFGTFNPPDVIKISLVFQNTPQSVADYFELIIHEYLHYASFNEEGKKLNSSFFNEGLAEYFARKIIKSNSGVDTNLGYPVNVKIIDQITKRISEGDLSDIYLNNDQLKLEKLLDRVYGEGFYQDNFVSFETLQYSSDTNQILKIANDIMGKIGGGTLDEADLVTTYSTFR